MGAKTRQNPLGRILVLVIPVIITCVSSLAAEPTTSTTRPATHLSREDWVTYTDKPHHLKYQHPKDWLEQPPSAYPSFISPTTKTGSKDPEAVLSINTKYLGRVPDKSGKIGSLTELEQSVPDFKVVENGEGRLGQFPCSRLIFTSTYKGAACKTLMLDFTRRGRAYMFKYRALAEAYDRFSDIAEGMAESFEVEISKD